MLHPTPYRESQELFEEIAAALVGQGEKQEQFTCIMAAVEKEGTAATFTSLHSLLEGCPGVQVMTSQY